MDTLVKEVKDDQKVKTYHIFVEVTKTDIRKVILNEVTTTGSEIKEKANVPEDSDLGKRVKNGIEYIADDMQITIKNGDRFVSLPFGSIS